MIKDNKKTPEIRFPGFTDDWEQRKLEEICDISSGVNAPNNENGKYWNLTMGSVTEEGKLLCSLHTNLDNKLLNKGQLIMPTRDVGKGLIIGRTAYISENNKYFAGNCLYVLTPEESINSIFLNQYMNSERVRNQFGKVMSGGSQKQITLPDVRDIDISFPASVQEQSKIADCFSDLDNLITLHQRKCDSLKELKKGMLQKMFPKRGATVPEIRFPEFTGDWEQRKITELGDVYIGLVTTMTEHYTDKGHLLIRNSDIKDGYFEFGEHPIYLDEEFSEQNKSRMHQLGDVITVHTGDIGTSAVISENEVNSIGFATIVTRPNQEILNSDYLATYLNTNNHKQWAISMATGDGRSNYNLKDYTNLIVPLPQIEEQKKIAAYISNMNNLITLHQRKCDALKELKKGMLQKMFV